MEDHDNNITSSTENNNNIITTNSSSSTTTTSSSTSKSDKNNNNNSSSSSEPVRSRWTPKPEQILILESIFNSGMVNPPKEETVRIRKLLEKFGAVGDANVFYWFQNRRSRSRRRQRQLQASLAAATQPPQPPPPSPSVGPPQLLGGGGSMYDFGHHHNNHNNNNSNIITNNTCTTTAAAAEVGSSSSVTCFAPNNNCSSTSITTNTTSTGGGTTPNFGDCCSGVHVDDIYASFSGQMGLINHPNHHHQMDCPSTQHHPNLEFQSGIITVFLNGVATQVPDGPFDMKAMFGEEVILVHSSGVPVPFNDFGISFHSLQHGESYFLVPRLA